MPVYAAFSRNDGDRHNAQSRRPALLKTSRHLGAAVPDTAGLASAIEAHGTIHWLRHKDEDDELAVLSDQERKILELIAEGLTNRQIGERLFLAEKTVKNHINQIFTALGVRTRAEAIVLWLNPDHS